jgi:hypothetical protein
MLVWHIRQGHFGDVRLDGFNLLALGGFEGNLWAGAKAQMGLFTIRLRVRLPARVTQYGSWCLAEYDPASKSRPISRKYPKRLSAQERSQVFNEGARFGGPSAVRGHQRVDRLRYAAPRGQGFDQRAVLKIVADKQFRRKANSQPREDSSAHGLRTVRAEIAGDLDRRVSATRPLERPLVGRVSSCVEDAGMRERSTFDHADEDSHRFETIHRHLIPIWNEC